MARFTVRPRSFTSAGTSPPTCRTSQKVSCETCRTGTPGRRDTAYPRPKGCLHNYICTLQHTVCKCETSWHIKAVWRTGIRTRDLRLSRASALLCRTSWPGGFVSVHTPLRSEKYCSVNVLCQLIVKHLGAQNVYYNSYTCSNFFCAILYYFLN